jgi:hypothetical protein
MATNWIKRGNVYKTPSQVAAERARENAAYKRQDAEWFEKIRSEGDLLSVPFAKKDEFKEYVGKYVYKNKPILAWHPSLKLWAVLGSDDFIEEICQKFGAKVVTRDEANRRLWEK